MQHLQLTLSEKKMFEFFKFEFLLDTKQTSLQSKQIIFII